MYDSGQVFFICTHEYRRCFHKLNSKPALLKYSDGSGKAFSCVIAQVDLLYDQLRLSLQQIGVFKKMIDQLPQRLCMLLRCLQLFLLSGG
ncbi:hypothetical protein D3C81_2201780 [compost metagenome]